MTSKTKETELQADATEATQQTPAEAPKKADTKVLVAPLAMYGVIALAIVAVIVLTAVKLEDELGDLDAQYAETEQAIEQATEDTALSAVADSDTATSEAVATETPVSTEEVVAETQAEATTVEVATEAQLAETTVEVAATAQTVDSTAELAAPAETAIVEQASTEMPASTVAEQTTAATPVSAASDDDRFNREAISQEIRQQMQQHITEMEQRDEQYLADMKLRDTEQVARIKQMLDEQIARMQQRVADVEQRNAEFYEARKAAMQQMQSRRSEMLNRI